jgi:hypothetical protein
VSNSAGVLRGKVSELTICDEHVLHSERHVAEFLSEFLASDAYTDNTAQPIVHQLQQIRDHINDKQVQVHSLAKPQADTP